MPHVTMRRGLWYGAYRQSTSEAAEMSQDPAWISTGLRQDYLSLAAMAKRVLDANPNIGQLDPDEELTGEVTETVLSLLEVERFPFTLQEPS